MTISDLKVIINEIIAKNNVKIKCVYYGTVPILQKHIRLLVLLFRASEWKNDIPTEILSSEAKDDNS